MPLVLRKAPPPKASSPRLKFVRRCDVMTLARLLAEHRGRNGDRDKFLGLIYGFLIYDHFAAAYKKASRNSREPIGESWVKLARQSTVNELYFRMHQWTDLGGRSFRDIDFALPIHSASPLYSTRAPAGRRPGRYRLAQLSAPEFVEIAWVVRCNILHGSFDPKSATTRPSFVNLAPPWIGLVWEMVKETVD